MKSFGVDEKLSQFSLEFSRRVYLYSVLSTLPFQTEPSFEKENCITGTKLIMINFHLMSNAIWYQLKDEKIGGHFKLGNTRSSQEVYVVNKQLITM